ncbi:MAG: hypothetical protein ACJ711_11060 [Ornithinibacter sp.]
MRTTTRGFATLANAATPGTVDTTTYVNGTSYAHQFSAASTGIPDCAASEVPATVTDNHGEYVSGAARAGVKGKDFVAIAKNVNLVGPYRR